MTTGFSIAAAVRGATPGSGLVIPRGRYYESVVIDRPLELVGDGSDGVVELWPQSGPGLQIKGGNAKVAIRGLILHGRSDSPLIAVQDGGQLLIEDCVLRGGSPACVVLQSEFGAELLTINRCQISEGNTGILLDSKFDLRTCQISECEIFRNNGAGIHTERGANPTVTKCQIYENAGSGIHLEGGTEPALPKITRCDIHHNEGNGITVAGEKDVQSGLVPAIRKCRIYDNEEVGILFLGTDLSGTILQCEISNFKRGIVLSAGTSAHIQECDIHDGTGGGIVIERGYQREETEEPNFRLVRSTKIERVQHAGIIIGRDSNVIVYGTEIRHCGNSGVIISPGGNGTLVELKIERNGGAGILVQSGGRGFLRQSDVRKNGRTSVDIADGGDLTIGDECNID